MKSSRMNRDILFRGKCSITGEWIYGTPVQGAETYSIVFGRVEGSTFPWLYAVEPETIGEWTGLTDVNGNKIFEGDIIKHRDRTYRVKYLHDMTRFAAVLPNGVFAPEALADCEVIGNAYDT